MNALKMHQLLLQCLCWLALTFTIFLLTVRRTIIWHFFRKTEFFKKTWRSECKHQRDVSNKFWFFYSTRAWKLRNAFFVGEFSSLFKSWRGTTVMITFCYFIMVTRVKRAKKQFSLDNKINKQIKHSRLITCYVVCVLWRYVVVTELEKYFHSHLRVHSEKKRKRKFSLLRLSFLI